MAGKRFSIEAIFKAVDKMTAPITRMQNRVGKFTRSVGAGVASARRGLNKFAGGMRNVALVGGVALGLVSAGMADVIRTGAEFEDALTSAVAKFPEGIEKGTDAFKSLQMAARRVGRETEFTATQSAQALDFLAMAGFNAKSAIAALPGVVDLATAGKMDLARATDIASDALGAFGLMSDVPETVGQNLARVNNVLAKTSTTANTTIEGLFEAMKEGGPIATSVGATIETFSALAGTMASSGIKASKAGTTLKRVFSTLAAPTGEAAKTLRRLGIQTKDSKGDMLDVIDIFASLEKRLKGLGSTERAAVVERIFGQIPLAGVNVLLKAGSEKLRDYRSALEDASGAAAKMAEKMRSTVTGRLKGLQSAVESVKISIFEMNEGPLAEIINQMTLWVRANEYLIATRVGEWMGKIIKAAVWLAGALGTAIGIIRNIGGALRHLGGFVADVVRVFQRGWAVFKSIDFRGYFLRMLGPIGMVIDNMDKLINLASKIPFVSRIADRLGFGGAEEPDRGELGNNPFVTFPQMVSPQERTSRTVEESRSSAEVTIRDDTGRAEVTKGILGPGIALVPTGGF